MKGLKKSPILRAEQAKLYFAFAVVRLSIADNHLGSKGVDGISGMITRWTAWGGMRWGYSGKQGPARKVRIR